MSWYYVRDGQRVGPRMRDEVAALLSTGALPAETLVWSAGMPNWLPAASTPEFAGVRSAAPAPGYPAPAFAAAGAGAAAYGQAYGYAPAAAAGDTSPHPWRRWFARIVDFCCFGPVLGMAVELAAPGALTGVNDLMLNVLLLAAWFPAEAFLLATFGTTPGKALLRITVTNADGTRLSHATAVSRSFQVWMGGLGFGIPLVLLITEIASYSRLESTGSTAWDASLGLRVTHGEMSTPRWIAAAAVIALILFLIGMGSVDAAGA
jgi:uncharacterized RDD family membrane protein YckC